MRPEAMNGHDRIFIGLGANLPGPDGPPRATLAAALVALERAGLRVVRRSRWYESAPVPMSDQPWYVNGVVEVEADLDPVSLLALLHQIEAAFGRTRTVRNEARPLDLDLLAYGDRVLTAEPGPLSPHPRLHERGFVLLPLAELAPDWRHPALGEGIQTLIGRLPKGQITRPIAGG